GVQRMEAHARLGAVAADEAFDRAVAEHQGGRSGAPARRSTGADDRCLHECDALVLKRGDPVGEPFADHDPFVPPPWDRPKDQTLSYGDLRQPPFGESCTELLAPRSR